MKKIFEKYFKTLEGDNGAFEVFENPSIYEIKEILKTDDENEFSFNYPKSQSLRGFILEDGKVLVWKDENRSHIAMYNDLKLRGQKAIPIYIHMKRDLSGVESFESSLWTMDMLGYDEKTKYEMQRKTENNSYLISLFRGKTEHNGSNSIKTILDELFKNIDIAQSRNEQI